MGKVPRTEQREDPVVTAVSMYVQDNNVSDLWSLEALGISDPIELKRKQELQKQIKKNFLQSVYLNKEGRYEKESTCLECHPSLGDNKIVSIRSLQTTIKKLKIDGFYKEYDAVFQESLAEGIIESVPQNEADYQGHDLPYPVAMRLAKFDLCEWEYNGDNSDKRQTPVLGIIWDKESDTLFINTENLNNLEFEKITKRTILSVTHKVFDPLGFLCPIMRL